MKAAPVKRRTEDIIPVHCEICEFPLPAHYYEHALHDCVTNLRMRVKDLERNMKLVHERIQKLEGLLQR